MTDNFRISLTNSVNLNERVLFEATPELVETRNVNYKTTDPIHAPGQIFSYTNTASRTFNISSVKLVSRTREEAERNLTYLWYFRAWTMPEFGRGGRLTDSQRQARQNLQSQYRNADVYDTEDQRRLLAEAVSRNGARFGTSLRGSPPTVLLLNAYSPTGFDRKKAHIHRVPVIIQNVSIPYPADTDYFPSLSGIPMPTIMTLDMTLAETHSPSEYSNFHLTDFKQGILRGF